jgi:hypothetical protein
VPPPDPETVRLAALLQLQKHRQLKARLRRDRLLDIEMFRRCQMRRCLAHMEAVLAKEDQEECG